MKIVITILLFVIVAFSSAYGYIYYSTKNSVDALFDRMRPFIDVNYRNFTNNMNGSISLDSVTIDSQAQAATVDIDSVELTLDSVFDFIDLEETLNSGEALPKFELAINHIVLDMALLDTGLAEQSTFEKVGSKVAALACGDIESIGNEQLALLGYDELDTSFKVDFEHDKPTATIDLVFDFILHDMGSYRVSTSIPNIESSMALANPNIKPSYIELELQDLGYHQKLIDFCSEKSNLTVENYTSKHVEMLKLYFEQANVTLSEGIYDAYKEFFQNDATLTFHLAPKSVTNLEYLTLYEVTDWPKILGLELYVNYEKVTDLAMNWDKDTVTSDLLNTHSKTHKAKAEKQVRKKSFSKVAVSDLAKFVNSTVQLETNLGKKYEGVILDALQSSLIVRIHMNSGNIDLPIQIQKISKAWVYK